jgi:hypothetical protein
VHISNPCFGVIINRPFCHFFIHDAASPCALPMNKFIGINCPLGGRIRIHDNDSTKIFQLFSLSGGYIHFLLCRMEWGSFGLDWHTYTASNREYTACQHICHICLVQSLESIKTNQKEVG